MPPRSRSSESSSSSSSSEEEERKAATRHRRQQRDKSRQLRRVETDVLSLKIKLAEKERLLCEKRLAFVNDELFEVDRDREQQLERRRYKRHLELPSPAPAPAPNDYVNRSPYSDLYLPENGLLQLCSPLLSHCEGAHRSNPITKKRRMSPPPRVQPSEQETNQSRRIISASGDDALLINCL